MTFAYHHPNHYKKLKPKQTGLLFGKKVEIDISKDLKDVHLENESIKKSNSEASLKLGKVIEKIKLGLGT